MLMLMMMVVVVVMMPHSRQMTPILSATAAFPGLGSHQVQDPPEQAALQAGPEAATGTLDTVGCMHICWREPSTVIRGLPQQQASETSRGCAECLSRAGLPRHHAADTILGAAVCPASCQGKSGS